MVPAAYGPVVFPGLPLFDGESVPAPGQPAESARQEKMEYELESLLVFVSVMSAPGELCVTTVSALVRNAVACVTAPVENKVKLPVCAAPVSIANGWALTRCVGPTL